MAKVKGREPLRTTSQKVHEFIPDDSGLSCSRCLLPKRNVCHDTQAILETYDRLRIKVREVLTTELSMVIRPSKIDSMAEHVTKVILEGGTVIWD